MLTLIKNVKIAGISHITGGGFYENLPRSLKSGLGMKIRKDSYKLPSIFRYIQEKGNIEEDEMYQVFNMGVGLAIVLDKEYVNKVLDLIPESFELGEVIDEEGIKLI